MDAAHVDADLVNVLFTEAQIQEKVGELAAMPVPGRQGAANPGQQPLAA